MGFTKILFFAIVVRPSVFIGPGLNVLNRPNLPKKGPAIIAAMKRHPAVIDVALAVYPFPRKGTGLYAFAEAPDGVNADDLAALQGSHVAKGGADLIQPVKRLPRHGDGSPRDDILRLIAMNQMTELDALVDGDAETAAIAAEIVAGRLNFTDRRISAMEGKG